MLDNQQINSYAQTLESRLRNVRNIAIGENQAVSSKNGKYITVRSHSEFGGVVEDKINTKNGESNLAIAGITVAEKTYTTFATSLIRTVQATFPDDSRYWFEVVAKLEPNQAGKLRCVKTEAMSKLPLSSANRKILLSLANDALKGNKMALKISVPSEKAITVSYDSLDTLENHARANQLDFEQSGTKVAKSGKKGKDRTPEQAKLASLRGHLQLAKNAATQLVSLGATVPAQLADKIAEYELEIEALKAKTESK